MTIPAWLTRKALTGFGQVALGAVGGIRAAVFLAFALWFAWQAHKWEALSTDLQTQADQIISAFRATGPEAAAALFYRDLQLDQEEQLGVWAMLANESAARNQIKKFKSSVTTKEAA